MTNVVPFTNRDKHLLQEIIDGHNMEKNSRDAWIEGVMKQATALAEARDGKSNGAFAAWLADNDADFYSKDDRAAYIKLGENPEAARIALEETGRTSVLHIVKEELQSVIDRLRHVSKTEEISATVVETVETVSITEEIVETISENNDESEKPEVKAVIAKPVKRIDPLTVIRGFMRAKNHIARTTLEKIADTEGGKKAVYAFAEALSTGKYGDGYDVGVSHLGPRAIFPDLPKKWSDTHNFIKNSAHELRTLTSNLDNLLAMKIALEAEKPVKNRESKFCDEWWFNNVQNKSIGKLQVGSDYNPINATAAALTARGIELKPIDHGPYSDCKAEDRYIPLRDDKNIIVCGVTIYSAGSEPWEKFCKIAGAYEFWKMLEFGYKLHESRVVERGFEYRRLRGPLAWGDPVFAQTIWNIGHAMATHPDKFETETSGPYVRGAGG